MNINEIGLMLLLGSMAGVLGGVFGIGGGLVIVPALVLAYNMELKTATGTSLFALIWPVGLLGVLEYRRAGNLRADLGIWIAVGLFLGAYFGAKITLSLPTPTLKRLYGVFLLIAGAYYLWQPPVKPKVAPELPPAATPADQVH